MMINGHDLPERISLGEPAWSSNEERQQLIDSAMAKLIAFDEAKDGR